MSSQESSEAESAIPKTNNIIVVGSMEDAKKLLGNKGNYVTKEEHENLASKLEELGKKYNQLLYSTEFFKAKMIDAVKDMSSREDDFVRRMSTELSLFKSEKTKSTERIRNSKHVYEEQARKASNPSKRGQITQSRGRPPVAKKVKR
tara:strand:- start:5256 stop:5696 length:441 start_codon:yes stop_codon:yes gene_type:complete